MLLKGFWVFHCAAVEGEGFVEANGAPIGAGLNGEVASAEAVGRVLGTQAASPLSFWIGLEPGRVVQLDDVVVTRREVPGHGQVLVAGVVTTVEARHEGASYDSDVFLIADGALPAAVVESAEVRVTRVEPEVFVPPLPGSVVYRAQSADRDQALYFDVMDRRIPMGLGRDGLPLYVNFDFLDGTRGAHVSISGISGVATKTSFATFLIYSIFNSGVLEAEAANTKALIFSVKGEDLLFLDHPNIRLNDAAVGVYDRLGLPARPFQSVHVFAPPRPGDPNGVPHVSARTQGVSAFFWTLAEFCAEELLRFVFADADDERAQYSLLVGQVAARLRAWAAPATDGGAVTITVPDGGSGGTTSTCRTFADLVDFVDDQLTGDGTRATWAGAQVPLGTVNAFLRRLRGAVRALSPIVRGDLPPDRGHSISTSDAQVSIVDLHNLPERAQRFVVGVVLRGEFARKESAGTARPLLFVVLDELNKYAPRDGDSPIKEILLDVAERGRSLGVILIGAQQTASEVERRIVSNCAVRVAGRLDPAEAARPEYGWLSAIARERATIAKPGTMFVAQPEIPVPLAVTFPFPAWATRPSEAGPAPVTASRRTVADPFAGLPGADDDVPPF
ncbi:ATP-binding protein [Planotetraspora sp. A-T 1434]|uniref:ATP-binding protein n=1 Tax=Planotetraspora sp. A-T 1434 TaxID=2979219 RepID=UPI0021C05AFC|nr:ATP-binding protein [Planotetraspora sp. A-T 1434]MCT9934561.1 ATP-binding protein [Planotetraspora sp. A-T 1434]